jgi:putative transposase
MRFDPDRQHRRSIRFPKQDYSRIDFYFVTLCVEKRECLLGAVVDRRVQLSREGQTASWAWESLPKHYPHLRLDAFVVMPNHIHGILELRELDLRDGQRRHGLPEIVRAFKSFSARRINRHRGTPGAPVWQRNYHDRILRDEGDLEPVRRYILENPAKWQEDPENPGVG